MTARLDYMNRSPELFKMLVDITRATKLTQIEERIIDLVAVRVSQLNGCTFCVDMHTKEARMHGERELRLYHLPAWRESTLFNPRERAALGWAEAATRLPERGIPDDLYELVRTQWSEKELSDLTFVVALCNAWNRLNAAFRPVPGSLDTSFGLDRARLA
jgi:AhpD family alkylhydroperoxidase